MALSISLVMPTLNSQAFIFDALKSVENQEFDGDVQVVIADGGSTDKTLEIARQFSFAKILEGPDNGIYHGFNRGIAAVEGEIVGFLNSDDQLPLHTLNTINSVFESDGQVHIVSGGISFGNSDGSGEMGIGVPSFNEVKMSVAGIMFGVPAINARYFRTDALREIGEFSTEAGLAADREFVLKIYNSQLRRTNIRRLIYQYRVHAGSATIAGDKLGKHRVWAAEVALSRFIIDKYTEDKLISSISKQAQLVAFAKQRMSGFLAGAALEKTSSGNAGRGFGDWAHLPIALWNWRKWRGKLSGH